MSQKQNGKNVVIAYASKKVKGPVRNFSSFTLEFDAMYWAICKKFIDYLLGSKFTVITDSNTLCKVMTAKKTAADMGKLADLAQYDFNIVHRAGRNSMNVDSLSRNPVSEDICADNVRNVLLMDINQESTPLPVELIEPITEDIKCSEKVSFYQEVVHTL